MSQFGIAGLQLELRSGDNLGQIDAELDLLRRRFPWVSMAVIGELAAFGPDPANAQPLPGPAEARLCAAAKRNQLWLVPGSLCERSGNQVFEHDTWVPFMSGFGGISLVLFPNGVVYYNFADDGALASFDWAAPAREVRKLGDYCQ